jgi:D-alanine-D-alanine ligase
MGDPVHGPGILTSALAMDKTMAKTVWRSHGLPTPRWIVVDPQARRSAAAAGAAAVGREAEQRRVERRGVDRPAPRGSRAAIALAGRSDPRS